MGFTIPDAPAYPSSMVEIDFRKDLLIEEFMELMEAIDGGHLPSVAGEVCDLIYVSIGLTIQFGLPLEELLNSVHEANMKKERTKKGKKAGKPSGWKPANLSQILECHGWRTDS